MDPLHPISVTLRQHHKNGQWTVMIEGNCDCGTMAMIEEMVEHALIEANACKVAARLKAVAFPGW